MNLYFISGLGADQRVFQKLELPDDFQIHYIHWLPVQKKESIESYCRRLSEQIDTTQAFSLVGLSFGGVIAVEMAKFLQPRQVVLISSFCMRKEVPWFYKWMKWTGLYRVLPVKAVLKPNSIVFRMFGAYNPPMKELLTNILQDTDPDFFAWAFHKLFSWNNVWKPANLIRLHGSEDNVLPYKKNMDAIVIKGGRHLMVYSKSEEVSEILKEKLMTFN